MKKAVRYLRFSHEGQSNSSIEKQELYTSQWLERNNVELIDTFVDAGHSAKSFERPDFRKLQRFLQKHHQNIDYLVVDQLDRFSRDAGDALGLIKDLQKKYNVQIVSASENITFDYNTPGSFFRTGLQMLLAEEDNINRTNKINGGIYTAKAKEGRYIHNLPPFGYKKEGYGKERGLVIEENKARLVRYIYDSFMSNISLSEIRRQAESMGFNFKGHSTIKNILKNPIYAGLQQVKEFKELPGGLYSAKHKPIIDPTIWHSAQEKIKEARRREPKLCEELPLRGVLKCHCGLPLTGAPSRGRLGGYYYYYKCQHKGHNNINAKKANKQMEAILESITLSREIVKDILINAKHRLEKETEQRLLLLKRKQTELEEQQKLYNSLEEKWLANQIDFSTYQRWSITLHESKNSLNSEVKLLNIDETAALQAIYDNVATLANLKSIYVSSSLPNKQVLLRTLFGNSLYYKEGSFHTSYINDLLKPHHKLREQGLLAYKGAKNNFE